MCRSERTSATINKRWSINLCRLYVEVLETLCGEPDAIEGALDAEEEKLYAEEKLILGEQRCRENNGERPRNVKRKTEGFIGYHK